MKTHYEVLGLDKVFTPEEIKQNYRELAKTLHPDRFNSHDVSESEKQEANRKMTALNEAYRVLSDPRLRTQYDQELQFSTQQAQVTSASNQPPQSKTYKKPYFTRALIAVIVSFILFLILNNSKAPNKRNFRDELQTAKTVFKPQVDQALKGNLPSLKETMEHPESLIIKRALSPELNLQNCLNAFPDELQAK